MGEKKLRPRRATLKKALEHVNGLFHLNPDDGILKPQTVYNAISMKKITNYGPAHKVVLDLDEVEALWGPKE